MRLIDADALPSGRVEWDDIQNTPTIDPVRRGRWAKAYNRGTTVYCTRCHRTSEYKYNYCPNCGAKMEGGGANV